MSNTDTAVKNPISTGRRRWNATDLGLIAVFAALVAGAALVPGLAVNGFGVPITFQTLAVMLTGLVLGPGRAFAAVGLYTLLGLAGLPIFSQGRSGLGILAGPSAGYIIAVPIAACVVGWLATIVIRRTTKARALWFFVSAAVTSAVVVHSLGIVGIALVHPRRQHALRVSGTDAHDRNAPFLQPVVEKGRKRSRLQHHPNDIAAVSPDRPRDRLRIRRAHASPHHRSGFVDRAKVRALV